MGKKLGQDDIIIVMDQAIYAKAQEIVLQKNEEFECCSSNGIFSC